jgi:hypothetical protein
MKRPPVDEDDARENERPTVNPPFDVEAYARATSSSEPPRRPSVPGSHGAFERPAEGGSYRPARGSNPEGVPEFGPQEPRSQQITITNELELERARVQSSARSEPPRRLSGSVLSIADARAPSSPSTPPQVAVGERSLSPSSIEAAVLGAISAPSAPEITERTIEDPVAEMRERFSLGDYTGALEMSELILAEEPGNLEAAECGENCRTVLENMYAARLGSLDRAPMVVVPRTQMRWLSMDHRAGFILSLIDGSSSIEMILDVSGMPKLDALRILHELVQQKIVAFR